MRIKRQEKGTGRNRRDDERLNNKTEQITPVRETQRRATTWMKFLNRSILSSLTALRFFFGALSIGFS